jgi:hypothetical protein
VQNLALTWQQAGLLSVGLGATAVGLHTTGTSAARRLVPYARETGIIAGLYALWQLAGTLSVLGTSGAYQRAHWLERVEHDLWLPPESSVQNAITAHPLIVQACNLYYATMHFGVLFIFLLWLFLRHRDEYARIRLTLALLTLCCLIIQLLPVAPPRLLPGYVDTAAQYGQSVYSLGLAPDQLSAMPSVHVGWAVLIGWAVWRIGSGPWRWLGWLHAAVTMYVVTATANHFWLDGVVAVLILAACVAAQRGTRRLVARWRTGRSDTATTPALADAVV